MRRLRSLLAAVLGLGPSPLVLGSAGCSTASVDGAPSSGAAGSSEFPDPEATTSSVPPLGADLGVDRAGVRRAVARAAQALPEREASFREALRTASDTDRGTVALFGYDPPGTAVQIAWSFARLHAEEGRPEDASEATRFLLRMARYRADVPAGRFDHRPEYGPAARDLPAVPNFFQLAEYADAYREVEHSIDDPAVRAELEEAVASSARYVLRFPEWGPHNRSALRAEGLLACARALPRHPESADWRRMGLVLLEDSLVFTEIEDAAHYQPIWLLAVLRAAQIAGDERVRESPHVRATLEQFAELVTPLDTIPDYGDAWWGSNQILFYECLEWGAALQGRGDLRSVASRLARALPAVEDDTPSFGAALCWQRLRSRPSPAPRPEPFVARQGPILDERTGKKILFRRQDTPNASYFLLNYCDEGDRGVLFRDFLRRTLAVEEEKMHHGHSDENSVTLWMDEGSLLLHEAGYRSGLPSGPNGAYRADVFHHGLVQRLGAREAGQELRDRLLDSGAYRPSRTELIDWVSFERADVSRTRRTCEALGSVHDRSVIAFPDRHAFLVVDQVQVQDDGARTLAPLFATGEVLEEGVDHVRGRTLEHAGQHFPDHRQLLVTFVPGPGDLGARVERFELDRHGAMQQVFTRALEARPGAGGVVTLVTWLQSVPAAAATKDVRPNVRRIDGEHGDVLLELHFADEVLRVAVRGDLGAGLRPDDRRPAEDQDARTIAGLGLSTDADLLIVRNPAEGNAAAWWAASGFTFVTVDGKDARRAEPSRFFQVDGTADHVGVARWRRFEGELPLR